MAFFFFFHLDTDKPHRLLGVLGVQLCSKLPTLVTQSCRKLFAWQKPRGHPPPTPPFCCLP